MFHERMRFENKNMCVFLNENDLFPFKKIVPESYEITDPVKFGQAC